MLLFAWQDLSGQADFCRQSCVDSHQMSPCESVSLTAGHELWLRGCREHRLIENRSLWWRAMGTAPESSAVCAGCRQSARLTSQRASTS